MDALRTHCTYKVISHNEIDGLHVDHFHDHAEARKFARDISEDGFDCVVCKVFEAFEAEEQDDDYGVIPGVDYPVTLHPEAVRC